MLNAYDGEQLYPAENRQLLSENSKDINKKKKKFSVDVKINQKLKILIR